MNLDFLKIIDEKADFLGDLSDYIWEHPELSFEEFACTEKYIEVLEAEGFTVEKNLAGISTAFSGRYGSGKPVIGLLGEFDALASLSQKAECCTQEAIVSGGSGQGCGHNYLGVGSFAAAIAVKKYLEETGASGTVIFYGCPAEEGGSGKAFMARDHVFDELDAAITWHPDSQYGIRPRDSLANYKVLYKFDGIASHAGGQPHLGRSALDAVELMDIGVNYLREHITDRCRIHYAITDAGGIAPNVVQAHAEVLYLMRAPSNAEVEDLYKRINNIAEGAALMTGTKASHVFIKGCSNYLNNQTMAWAMNDVIKEIPMPEYTEEELEFGRKFVTTALAGFPKTDPVNPYSTTITEYTGPTLTQGSTDVGDVSWVCPTLQFMGATNIKGTPNHSWQQVAQGKNSVGKKATLWIGKCMAAAAVKLLQEPDYLAAAKAEHKETVGPDGYKCPIPEGVKPGC